MDPGRLPVPQLSPSPEAAPFWEACRRRELILPYCTGCRRFFFYPRTLCPGCGGRDVTWRQSAGRGELYTFCIQHASRLPGFRDAVPFVTAVVELEEGPRLMTLLVGVPPEPESIRCGMPVEVVFTDLPDGNVLPVFRPRSGTLTGPIVKYFKYASDWSTVFGRTREEQAIAGPVVRLADERARVAR